MSRSVAVVNLLTSCTIHNITDFFLLKKTAEAVQRRRWTLPSTDREKAFFGAISIHFQHSLLHVEIKTGSQKQR